MLSCTVSVTDQSLYLNNDFTDGEELITYSLKHLEQLPFKFIILLEDQEYAVRIAGNGKERAENWISAKDFARSIL